LYLLIGGGAASIAASLDICAPHRDVLPPAAGWAAAFFLSTPCWSLCVSVLCAVVSSMARDVRAAQQGVWFIVFFATLICGSALTRLMPSLSGQLIFACAGALLGSIALGAGAVVMSRDLTH
ncbi:MAG: hypothetical protein AAFV53_38720, partial [Myxococcota bacterium]